MLRALAVDGGAVVPGAVVTLWATQMDSLQVTTGSGGVARLALEPGAYEIRVQVIGYERLRSDGSLRLARGDTVLLYLATGCERRRT